MAKASDNEFPSVLFGEQSSDPATPSAGTARLFVNNAATPELELIDDSGTVTTFGAGGGGSGGGTTYLTTTTLGSSATTMSVSGLASSYEAIKIIWKARTDRADNLDGVTVQMGNSTVNTGSVYAYYTQQRDIGNTNFTEESAADTSLRISRFDTAGDNNTAGVFGFGELMIYGYADGDHATFRYHSTVGGADPRFSRGNGAFLATDVIDIVTFSPHSGTNFLTGSQLVVYGYNAS